MQKIDISAILWRCKMKEDNKRNEELTMVKLPDGRIVNANNSITHVGEMEDSNVKKDRDNSLT
jgi:hypothetical protein